jgi:three-Cys-motif partner protein
MGKVKLDEVGYWSEVKLDIIKKYAVTYSTIMNKQSAIRNHYYIDGFAGAGVHISKTKKEIILGSSTNALNVNPPFSGFHFIDLDGGKAQLLGEISKDNPKVKVYEGDCNKILIEEIFPLIKYEDYNRALCVLDPYGLHLNWEIMYAAGQSKTVEIFLNFSVMDMNMNVLWNDQSKVSQRQIDRMNAFWGDESWRDAAYEKRKDLFDDTFEEKTSNRTMAETFRKRLKEKAGFNYVPEPIPMRNTTGATIYYLFFASPNETGGKIVKEVFEKYKNRGIV